MIEKPANESLLRRIASRDEAALSQLWTEMAGAVRAVAERILRDPALADEATLEVFLQVWNRAGEFRVGRGSGSTWILLLARSRALDLLRRRGRETRNEVGLPADPEFPLTSPGRDPFASGEHGERCARVRAALDRIAPEERRALWSSFFLGLSHKEIAERLAEPLGTIKTRIRSGLAKLERLLTPLETGA